MPAILGISAFYHDSAAAIVIDGTLRAAAQQERFSRRKHDNLFPIDAINFCLTQVGLRLSDLDAVVFYEDPELKLFRILDTVGADHPNRRSYLSRILPDWLQHPDLTRERLLNGLRRIDPAFDASRLGFAEHHRSHAASAFFPSPFDDAAVLTVDGVGEFSTTSIHVGRGAALEPLRTIEFPDSLGLLYAAFTAYLGFKINDGEYKVMGLAPYGKPVYADLIKEHLIRLHPDGSFTLNQDYFDFFTSHRMFNDRFTALFGQRARSEFVPLWPFHMDVAASIQAVTTEAVIGLARMAVDMAGSRRLCMAGGVALNCVANGALVRSGVVDDLWIQPAAGDAGGAVGAAFLGSIDCGAPPDRPRRGGDGMMGGYLGPAFDQASVETYLRSVGATYEVAADDDQVIGETVRHLEAGRIVGWFQGRMEFGPRALGARSILADPRNPEMQRTLNLKTKDRESFRPFAPAITREAASTWFDLDRSSPYMLLVAPVREQHRLPISGDAAGLDRLHEHRSVIPAVTHVDFSARVQTVEPDTNPLFHRLIDAFGKATGVPVLVNTSFNVNNEPIVCTPEDAFRCFLGTQIDVLVMGRCIMRRDAQHVRLPGQVTVIRTERYEPESLWSLQWYGGGMTHALNNWNADAVIQSEFHEGPVTRYETFADWIEAAVRASRNGILIVTCGGSTTAGSKNWPSRLQGELTALGSSERLVVINLGQPYFCSFDSTLALETFLARAEPYGAVPDLVISMDGFNDVLLRITAYIRQLRDGKSQASASALPQEGLVLARAGVVSRSDDVACPELVANLSSTWSAVPQLAIIRLPPAVADDVLRRFEATLRELRAVCAPRGLPCINVLQPILLPSSTTLSEYASRVLTFTTNTTIPDAARATIGVAGSVSRYRLRRHVEDAYSAGFVFEGDIGGPFNIRLEPIFAEASSLWLRLNATAEPDFVDLLKLFSENPYPAFDFDAAHYTAEGSRRIAAQLAQRLSEHRERYLANPESLAAIDNGEFRILRQLYAQYGKDVFVQSLPRLQTATPRAELDREVQALFAASGHLADARRLDAGSAPQSAAADVALESMVTMCVAAVQRGTSRVEGAATSSWREPAATASYGALAKALRAQAATIRTASINYRWEIEKGEIYTLF